MNISSPFPGLMRRRRGARGFTLIELMVAMLLGLIVIAGVASVFLANMRTFRSTSALSEVQASSRIAFELMARDIRQAGLTGCNSSVQVVNVLNNSPANGGTDWWADWGNAVRGFEAGGTDDPATASRVSGTDSLMLLHASGVGYTVASVDASTATLVLNEASPDLVAGDVVFVCDPANTTLMQLTAVNAGSATVTHAASGTPGNSSTNLGRANGPYGRNARVAKLSAHDWYIGDNPAGSSSLYRAALTTSAGAASAQANEIIRGITGMQLSYHQQGNANYVAANAVTDWGQVDAVHVVLTLNSTAARVGTDGQALARSFEFTTTIRNR